MKVEGGGLYFVEGVLATIEVKSTINKAELKTSLENCKSVLSLVINGEHPEEAEARITFYMERENITHEQAEQRFWYMFHPATYVFGFSSKLSLQATAQCIADWWEIMVALIRAIFLSCPELSTQAISLDLSMTGVSDLIRQRKRSNHECVQNSPALSVVCRASDGCCEFQTWFEKFCRKFSIQDLGVRSFG